MTLDFLLINALMVPAEIFILYYFAGHLYERRDDSRRSWLVLLLAVVSDYLCVTLLHGWFLAKFLFVPLSNTLCLALFYRIALIRSFFTVILWIAYLMAGDYIGMGFSVLLERTQAILYEGGLPVSAAFIYFVALLRHVCHRLQPPAAYLLFLGPGGTAGGLVDSSYGSKAICFDLGKVSGTVRQAQLYKFLCIFMHGGFPALWKGAGQRRPFAVWKIFPFSRIADVPGGPPPAGGQGRGKAEEQNLPLTTNCPSGKYTLQKDNVGTDRSVRLTNTACKNFPGNLAKMEGFQQRLFVQSTEKRPDPPEFS